MHKNTKGIEIVTRPTISMLGEVKHEVSSKKDLKSWLVEIKVNGKVNQAQRVFSQNDLALATRTMLRTEHLLGNFSSYTRAATQGSKPADHTSRIGSGKPLRPIAA